MQEFDLNTPPEALQAFLDKQGWLHPGETVREVATAGEGNMNVVLRLRTSKRSLVLKQSRPYVRKYPDIPAPVERIAVEQQFYQAVAGTGIRQHLPEILGYDPAAYTLLMQDLGAAEDMTGIYAARALQEGQLQTLMRVLRSIHQAEVPDGYPDNLELRRLNHQHIFVLPFMEENGFALDTIQPGLEALARPFKKNTGLKAKITSLGQEYLSPGKVLLHGDYYPGSWLDTGGKTYVIDPEFSFTGFPEFDLGVMAAHLLMAAMDPAMPEYCLQAYGWALRAKKVQAVAGTEILRRLIGLAQLPLQRNLDEKAFLLEEARKLLEA